ncbi:MAG TPA: hypothetical protein VFJ58_15545 [Armatimonadota bacterium]|nr:hypothetical protein [Armatimonadota bacterium]
MNPSSPLAVVVAPAPPANAARTVSYPEYVHEILAHAGVCYTKIERADLPDRLGDIRLLLTIGDALFSADLIAALRTWLENGGAWLAVGGLCGAGALFGAEPQPPSYSSWGGGISTLGEGYMEEGAGPGARGAGDLFLRPSSSVLRPRPEPSRLHFFNGAAVRVTTGDVRAMVKDTHNQPTSRPGMIEARVGNGRCLFIAPDITGTIVRIQQGIAVTRDGISAPDGTAPITDGVLKSGDGAVLDWILDRQPVPGVPGLSAFLEPVADRWRELLLQSLFYLAVEQNAPLPLLWLYPRDLPALGHFSHDTDGNDPALAHALLKTLDEAGVRSTWCVILPGYGAELIQAIRDGGHELAMHFDAMTPGCLWSEEELEKQWRQLYSLLGDSPVSNKNHYLRWEGDTEYFDWLARRGVKLDQSKGASKTGEAGFNFGTSHPYFPADPSGRMIDVLELATPTQDLEIFAPPALLEPLLESVVRSHGILHLLFHPAHIGKPGVAEALRFAVNTGRERGLEWWTAREISAWERARRAVRWSEWKQDSATISVTLEAGEPLTEPSILLLDTDGESRTALVNGVERECHRVERWGFTFWSVSPEPALNNRFTIEWRRRTKDGPRVPRAPSPLFGDTSSVQA